MSKINKKKFNRLIKESNYIKKNLIKNIHQINRAIEIISNCILNGGKVLLCGNGGSAADAQHLAAEFLVRLKPSVKRNSIPAISLATDTSTLTATGNDYSFNDIFSRPLSSLGHENDVLIALSTSGNSKNIIKALKVAKKNKIKSISFLGNKGGMVKKFADLNLIITSRNTARIQENHIFLGHLIFENVEQILIKKKYFK